MMSPPRKLLCLLASAALATLAAGCPPTEMATRDGGQPCTMTSQCNATGQTCGVVHLCVQGFCAESTVIRACDDGGYPDGPAIGECQSIEDCNEGQLCGGALINCVNSLCDRDGPRVVIECPDSGTVDAGDAARGDGAGGDARSDATSDGASSDGASSDGGLPPQPDGFGFPG